MELYVASSLQQNSGQQEFLRI